MNDVEKALEELEKLSRYAKILKSPDEFFHHMQGHITELSFILSAFAISEIGKSIREVLEKQQELKEYLKWLRSFEKWETLACYEVADRIEEFILEEGEDVNKKSE